MNFLYPPLDFIIDKRACIFNVSNENFDYVTELSFVFGDILIFCYILMQKDSILIINHYIFFYS